MYTHFFCKAMFAVLLCVTVSAMQAALDLDAECDHECERAVIVREVGRMSEALQYLWLNKVSAKW